MKFEKIKHIVLIIVLILLFCWKDVFATDIGTESTTVNSEETGFKDDTINSENIKRMDGDVELAADDNLKPDNESVYQTKTKNIIVPAVKKNNEIISVVLPIVEDIDPFSFFIDPKNILYNSYQNINDIYVEEGVNILFINRRNDYYGLSSCSDRLSITNRSTVPIDITITAKIENIDGINLVQNDENVEASKFCDLYIALVDGEGNELPLSEQGEVSITVRLNEAPMDTYAYEYDEKSGEYRYACSLKDIDFATYSFGLRGACSMHGDWTMIFDKPRVSISWNVDPVMPKGDEVEVMEEGDEEPGETKEDTEINDTDSTNFDDNIAVDTEMSECIEKNNDTAEAVAGSGTDEKEHIEAEEDSEAEEYIEVERDLQAEDNVTTGEGAGLQSNPALNEEQ